MEVLGPAQPAPTQEELISLLEEPIRKVLSSEMEDEADVDRIWLLRKIQKNYLYYRDLQYFVPAIVQGLVDATGIDGSMFTGDSSDDGGDYSQNIFLGYCRKLEAVLGTRIPNVVAVPNDPSSEEDQAAAKAANDAAEYIRQKCDFSTLVLWLVFRLFISGTCFVSIEWVEDGDRYGWKEVPQEGTEPMTLGDQDTGEFPVQAPQALPPQRIPKGGLEIEVLDVSEVSVPLDSDGRKGTDGCLWIHREHEVHKARLLKKYGKILRQKQNGMDSSSDRSAAQQYGESVRSSMASPIGLVRPKRESKWTETWEDWTPDMYELTEDQIREVLGQNFPDGLRATCVRGKLVALENRKIGNFWQECTPEPTERIMGNPLGDDWAMAQDVSTALLNQQYETVIRSNEPGFADSTRVDLDAYQRRRSTPGNLIPAMKPAGGRIEDLFYRPPSLEFSEQIPVFAGGVLQTARENSGLTEAIWGGDTSDPTARQTELKTNAAIRQLGIIWLMIGKTLEKVNYKGTKILADHEDGVLSFSKKNQFGKFDSVTVVMEDLRGGEYHFEADEAIPMTWGQQRDLVMWFLDKPPELLETFGLNDPLNVYDLKNLIGLPGMRVPHLDDRDKGLDVLGKLVKDKSVPGQPGPDGSPGDPQPSIQPDWEDDHDFMAKLVKAYLTVNFDLKESNPDGYDNIVLYGKAQEQAANVPEPKPPVKASVAVSLKGEDLGDPAVQAALEGTTILPGGVQVQQQPMPKIAPSGIGVLANPNAPPPGPLPAPTPWR